MRRLHLYLFALLLPLAAWMAGLFDRNYRLDYQGKAPVTRAQRAAAPRWTQPCWQPELRRLARSQACVRVRGRVVRHPRRKDGRGLLLLVHGRTFQAQWLPEQQPPQLPKLGRQITVTGPLISAPQGTTMIVAQLS